MNPALKKYVDEGNELVRSEGITKKEAANRVIVKYGLSVSVNTLRREISTEYNNTDGSALANECDEQGIDIKDVNYYWYKGKRFSINVRNNNGESKIVETIKEILDEYKPDFKVHKLDGSTVKSNDKALKATLSDMHVGMEPNKGNRSIFKYEYNADIFNQNIDHVIQSIIKEYQTHGRFKELIIQDLGDPMDGYNNMTTRQGHQLQQNMGNVDQFKTYVFGKLRLAETAIKLNIADEVKFKSVSNCNHAGEFGEIANIAIKGILDRVYPEHLFDFYIQSEFIEHFEYGDHAFIMTHGKDKEHMKHGLPKHLDPKTINYIQSYIDHNEITSKYIHFEKGDLHCSGLDRCKKFDYRNFMSFAPPSSHSQTNYGDNYSGYAIQVIPKYSNDISHCDYLFEFKKAKKIA